MYILNTRSLYLFQLPPDTAQEDNLNLHIPQPEQMYYSWQPGLWRKDTSLYNAKKRKEKKMSYIIKLKAKI